VVVIEGKTAGMRASVVNGMVWFKAGGWDEKAVGISELVGIKCCKDELSAETDV
jgi:hypothetical protein